MNNDEICFMPATMLASEIRDRRLSAVEVVRAFLDRITRVNPALNAYVTLCEAQALKAAALADKKLSDGEQPGPLHGVPFSVKDLVFTAGVRTTLGSRIYENFVPKEDAVAVSRLRAAGAILLGKTNTPEFGYKATTENLLFGPTRNPWNRAYTPGGSSGGAAAATAAGLSPLSVSTDGGGSIRIPASFWGVFGLSRDCEIIPAGPEEFSP
jgi:Asp-tRNA(Asn)/Glu-tRNA(Gln) amidotransferase A subunit family amidase